MTMAQSDIASAATILVVDESTEEQSLLFSVLSHLYKVVTVVTADEANRCMDASFLPDVIILSDGLPEASSLGFCRQLKRYVRTRDISIILLINVSMRPASSWLLV